MANWTSKIRVDRRKLLIGGGATAGLLVAWSLWPRSYQPNLRAAQGETVYNAFLKIGTDGRVIVAVPQAEIGQGVYTSLPQILADELGADWRTVGVEPAPLHPVYANALFAKELSGSETSSTLGGAFEHEELLMLTGGSTSIRSFDARLREAGATARALLMKAAARRWDADWEALDTAGGFVVHGQQRLSFAELAAEAASEEVPKMLPMRGGNENRLTGQSVPRLDLPSKVDGTAQFAGDVRLPDMLFASVRQGPRGKTRLLSIDKEAADAVPGVVAIFQNPKWAGAAATNWWAANQAVQAMKPVFAIDGPLASDAGVSDAFDANQESDAVRIFSAGEPDELLTGDGILKADYRAGIAPTAALETLTATARHSDGRLEIWAPTQAPGLARKAAARASGLSESQITVYRTLIGSGYGRKIETAAIEQAVAMAMQLNRPVQLVWSRAEELAQDNFRPPARASISARIASNGTIAAWGAKIAAPTASSVMWQRLNGSAASGGASYAVEGAVPPYDIPAVAIDHVSVDIGLATGLWRSGAHSYTAFFTECFIDELARKAGLEPFSYRMQMLGGNPRLARVLSTATALGGWDGGASGSFMGIAAHSAYGSHVATLVEVEVNEAQKIRVRRAVVAVDCGRVVNPNIVRQLVEGGTIYGISGATGNPVHVTNGLPDTRTVGSLGLPRLADSPEVIVEIVPSEEEPGGVTELAVPTVAPAIANAVFALTGQRLRSLPLVMGSGA